MEFNIGDRVTIGMLPDRVCSITGVCHNQAGLAMPMMISTDRFIYTRYITDLDLCHEFLFLIRGDNLIGVNVRAYVLVRAN